MNDEKNSLRNQTMRRYRLLILRRGFRKVSHSPIYLALALILLCGCCAAALHYLKYPLLWPLYAAAFTVLYLFLTAMVCYLAAAVPEAQERLLLKEAIVNAAPVCAKIADDRHAVHILPQNFWAAIHSKPEPMGDCFFERTFGNGIQKRNIRNCQQINIGPKRDFLMQVVDEMF